MLTTALLALTLNTACVSPTPAHPTVEVERAAWVRSAHATVVRSGDSQRLAVELRTSFPALPQRRTVTVEGFASDGRLVFTRDVVACQGMNDARHHRTVTARASIDLPEMSQVVVLRVRAGK